ncbi:MAG: hypothetical protein Q4D41_09000 [Prevotellaceae bacterium]|nr:hypothetical protein [Prevotellaceae bacterium]
MKRTLAILLLSLLVLNVSAQKKRFKNDFSPEKFQIELEQFITRNACLTPQEASKFFPLYNEMRDKQRSLNDEKKQLKRIKPVTEAECKKYIQEIDKIDLEVKQLQRRYHEEFMRMLPASKVYDIIKAEDKFHRQAFKRMADKVKKK